uniref:NADH-ubiquinone oxidoreductase chain 2 n=1 Tax=Lysmata boggessi TaxID=497604 RepID=A0A8F5CFD2_9EUCA|nr:NADH dehydrogenase subunit 2 [Lysmata boggessi]QVT15587.1 NADH dehydrogenase subunit 2 [Lysmata boggessi]QXJ42679.1 NADH dehydrogenase subunit 2 [Lysmata boggessi]
MSFLLSPARVLFLSTTLLGTLLATSSCSWLTCWMGLELNLLSFIPIVSSNKNLYGSESALKYFLIQALGSAIILGSAPAMMIFVANTPEIIILAAIVLKLGAAPLHFWFPAIMQGLPWFQGLMLMTWQKIAPILLISYLPTSRHLTFFILATASLSALIGGVSGMNQVFLRKILAYSSISHLGWMLTSLSLGLPIFINYFIIYSLTTSSVVFILNSQQIFHLKNIFFSSFNSISLKVYLFLSFFSLGGLPPFLGFFPKLLVISGLAGQSHVLWLSMLLISALLTLFFYIRIAISSITFSSSKSKYEVKLLVNKPYATLTSSLINFAPILGPLLTIPPY